MRRLLGSLGLLVALALFAAGCGGSSSKTTSSSSGGTASTSKGNVNLTQ